MNTMDNDNTTYSMVEDSRLSFGAYLKKVRIEKGLSIEDIMDYTRISKYIIQQIEEENQSKLPEEVYLKGFLKSYAQAVGVNPADIIDRYKRTVGNVEEKKEKVRERRYISQPSFPFMKVIGVLFVIIAMVMGSVKLVSFISSRKAAKTVEVKTEIPVPAPAETKPEVKSQNDKPVSDVQGQTDQTETGYRLEVIGIDNTTVKISVDGGAPEEHDMKAQDHIELKAEEKYNILIGNSCGVHLFLNGKDVKIPGKCGQTVNIQLP